MPLKIPPAIATPLIKGGRGDLNTIYSIQEVCCVSPELETWLLCWQPCNKGLLLRNIELLLQVAIILALPAQAVVAPIAAEFCGRFEAKVVEQEAPTAMLGGNELLHGSQLFWVGLG